MMTDQPNEIDIDESSDKNSYSEFLETIRRNMDPNSNTVLVVDDEKGIRMTVARDVRSFAPGIVVHQAANGQEALTKLAEIRNNYVTDPLLIVLDLNMPIMDGWQVIETLKSEYEEQGKTSGIPILILSSTSGEKGAFFRKKSVHDGKTGYTPLITVAKESCVDESHYDASGETGLLAWLAHFIKE